MSTLFVGGSRDAGFGTSQRVWDDACYGWLNYLYSEGRLGQAIEEVVHGNARGADLAGDRWAAAMGIEKVERFSVTPEQWKKTKAAGHIRNAEMKTYLLGRPSPQGVILWDGQSRGTLGMMKLLDHARIPFIVIDVLRGVELNPVDLDLSTKPKKSEKPGLFG